jgi:Patatin-like phospholipase
MGTRFRDVTTFLSYCYLLRIPLLIGLVLIALPPFAVWGSGRPLLENLFVLTASNIFWVMIVALILAWSLLVVSRVVLLNGEARFGLDSWMTEDVLRGWHLLVAALPAMSLFICACVEKNRVFASVSWWEWVSAGLAGAAIAYAAGFLGLVISITLAPRYHPKEPEYAADRRFQIPFFCGKRMLKWADGFRLIKLKNPNRFANWTIANVPEDLRCGYADAEGHLYPGQWLVLTLMTVSVIVYLSVGTFRAYRLGMPTSVPAVTYVLILMLVLTWVLSVIAFFLDRYRVPLILPIVLFCTLAGQFPQSDHYFAMRDGVLVASVSPAETLAGHRKGHPTGVVVIATAGGGIQAAGWTARVLTGLQEQCSAVDRNANFADSIAAISAVSGGAVGTLFFMNQYNVAGETKGFHPNAVDLQNIVEKAETPALSDVAWAIAYVEPSRALFPYWRNTAEEKVIDRGFVLEQTWRNQGSIFAYLSNWREGVAEGWRPAVIFNATIAETGQPFLMSTSDFDTGSTSPARQTFTRAYPNSDLPVVTATRLAASFPFVSPASRPLSSRPEYHLVDGGYYDNFGVDSLIAWLNQGLTNLLEKKKKDPTVLLPDVLFIQIRSFPTDAFPAPTSKGWFYQNYAPLDALMSVRTTAQLVRDRDELELLKNKWAKEGVRIETPTFAFPGVAAPLSWELTEPQKSDIQQQWDATLTGEASKSDLQTVRLFCGAQSSRTTTVTAPQ